MFFYASKIIWFFLSPSTLLTALTVMGALLAFTRLQRLGRNLTLAGSISLLFLGLSPLGQWLILPLEQRFARPLDLPIEINSIVLLGGFADTREGRNLETVDFNESADRFVVTVELARQYPDASIILSGGKARFSDDGIAEADFTAAKLERFGIDQDRLLIENRSRNTAENAIFSRELVGEQGGGAVLLVTSAFHMPRSVGVFRTVGWTDIIPYPVDYRSVGPSDRTRGFPFVSKGLWRVDLATKEWVGLFAYWVTGRTDELYPSPEMPAGSAKR